MIRVLLVDDFQLTRGALGALLEQEADMMVVAEIGADPGLAQIAATLRPDVVIFNTDLAIGQLLSLAADMHASAKECAVLVLVDQRRPITFPPGRRTGVPSFLVKDVSPDVLVDTVRRVAAGDRVIDERIAIAALVGTETVLTNRELEVLGLAAEGASVEEIAARLYLSLGTVRNYLSKIIMKTGARNRIDAIRIAREAGWLV